MHICSRLDDGDDVAHQAIDESADLRECSKVALLFTFNRCDDSNCVPETQCVMLDQKRTCEERRQMTSDREVEVHLKMPLLRLKCTPLQSTEDISYHSTLPTRRATTSSTTRPSHHQTAIDTRIDNAKKTQNAQECNTDTLPTGMCTRECSHAIHASAVMRDKTSTVHLVMLMDRLSAEHLVLSTTPVLSQVLMTDICH